MNIPPRQLAPNQRSQVWIHDVVSGQNTLILDTKDLLLEAPNWTLHGDALILNGAGTLWRVPIDRPTLQPIAIGAVPPVNNDHVLDPDGTHIFLSAFDDWHLYRAPVTGGTAVRITGKDGPEGLMHFLHGVSPDGMQLAFVGVRAEKSAGALTFISAEIYTVGADGTGYRQVTSAGSPADGPEYSPDGQWLYFNTEAFSGHAQIARMRPDGSELTRMIVSQTVDWFPHISPDGRTVVYLAYPPGTAGHPPDLWVDLMIVLDGRWARPVRAVRLFGGQGTINVNSWSPDSCRFAYVAYPVDIETAPHDR
ncbi:PD40 domain-containing protein [Mesorhizobium sp. YR577]|uniref:TolB family protein n=1 Tax=Mesorhizobium sp. YR577 TaxID=1884373 RepID=UPI0008E954EC|nr:PD40 domain-containing protein [Mesorhizobium sp. YR577]SFU21838.1 WD40-like Beta Propeller Repeat [Mesorhizobium sp. YR577]